MAINPRDQWFDRALSINAVIASLLGGMGSTEADPRVRDALRKSGMKYHLTPTGDFVVGIRLPSGRTHLVIVDSSTSQLGSFEIRDVWALSYVGTTIPRADVLEKVASRSARTKIGAFELHAQADGAQPRHYGIVFNAKVSADLSPEHLAVVVCSVAAIADEMEAEITSADAF